MATRNLNPVSNTETAKAKVEVGKELTESERLNAWFANHAAEHYCTALGYDLGETTETLNLCKKEDGIFWLYTQPAIDGVKADGTKLPSRAEWEKQNEGAVFVDTLVGKRWYKRPFVIGDARGVRSIVSGYNRYIEAKEGAAKKVDDLLAATARVLGVSVEALKAMQK